MTGVLCSECGEPAQQVQPTGWVPAWGPTPEWSHLDGSSLCPTIGDSGYEPCKPKVVP
ncbi:hypothetical protein EDD94_2813 [Streptomyces sp. PanSC9]|nr:hypothetical protein EDD94_2813 [Streptomyces sp. PanSC9]